MNRAFFLTNKDALPKHLTLFHPVSAFSEESNKANKRESSRMLGHGMAFRRSNFVIVALAQYLLDLQIFDCSKDHFAHF